MKKFWSYLRADLKRLLCMSAMMILICGALAFADSLCEDADHNYMRWQINDRVYSMEAGKLTVV